MLKVLSFQKLKYFLLAFQILFVLFLLFNSQFSSAQEVCLPLNGYLVWSGPWEQGRIPMAASSTYVLTASPFYVSGGNVGLNTTNPVYTLDVRGTTSVEALCIRGVCHSAWPSGGITGSGSQNQVAFWTDTNNLSGSSKLLWDNNSSKLQVNGNVVANNFLGTINASNVSAGTFGANTGGGNYSFLGNVGIGTTAPGARLDIRGYGSSIINVESPASSNQAGIRFYRTGESDRANIYLENYGTSGTVSNANRLVIESADDGDQDYIVFRHRPYWTSARDIMNVHYTKITIDPNVNVGIGTTAPRARLHIKTNDITTVPFQVEALVGWSHRKPITINNTGGALTDYQVLVTLNTASLISAGKMRSDCGDIRFTDSDGTKQLNYWLESGCNSASTRLWVKVPSIPAGSTKTIYVYYGNPSATSASSVSNTFIANSIYAMSGSCGDSTNCNGMDNHAEADAIRGYAANICTKYVDKIYWGSVCDGSSPTSNVREYFYSRFRFLFLPDVSGTWYFAVDSDDGSEIVKSNADMYGGIHEHTIIATWYGGHSWCNCQSHNGPISLTAGQAVWLDYIQVEWGIYEAAVVWVLKPGGAWNNLNTANYPNQIFARKYTSPEPTTSVGAEESAAPQQQTVFYIQNQTGNVGIGTTNPGYKLDVAGYVHATNFYTSSDIRFKQNILPLNSSGSVLEKLNNLQGVYFEWNDVYKNLGRGDDKRHIGLIAQEVEKEFPELVSQWGDGSDYRAVDYSRFTAVLLEGLKELNQKLEEFKNKKEIQLIDKSTNEIYCIWLENGEFRKSKGECK